MQHYLRDYFPPGHLDFLSIDFDLGTDERLANWPHYVSSLLAGLRTTYEHVVVLITDHTDCDTGDLFLGTDAFGKVNAARVDEVSSYFLTIFIW